MKFQTQVRFAPSPQLFSHANSYVCLGSCFASEIGGQLETTLFDCLTNPLGNLFNPLALSEVLIRASENRGFRPEEFFEHQELWRHFLVHSSLCATEKERSIDTANAALQALRSKLKECDLLILTLGSAWIYQKQGYSGYIGHNHKLPLKQFKKSRLPPDEISLTLAKALSQIRELNPNLRTCITVSPVRHTRDGLHENNLSKASLLLAADQLVSAQGHAFYFPAYEMLLDELRDYRFYAEDLVHPSRQATEIIWSKFCDHYITEESRAIISETRAILTMLAHRHQHTDTLSYRDFKSTLLEKIQSLSARFPKAKALLKRYEELP